IGETFSAGSQPPVAARVTNTVILPPGARLPAPVRSFQSKLPNPTPSGAGAAETKLKQAPLYVSSSGSTVTAELPVFVIVIWKTTSDPFGAGPGTGLNTTLFTVIAGSEMMTVA